MDEREQNDDQPVEDLDTTEDEAGEVKGGSLNFSKKAGTEPGAAFKQGFPIKWGGTQ